MRGHRGESGNDLRLPLVVGGSLVLWSSDYAIEIPGGGRLPSPLLMLSGVVPGLDAVRALRALRFDVYLVVSLLAGYGSMALIELVDRFVPLGRAAHAAISAALAAVGLEVFVPSLATIGYGSPLRLSARALAAPPALASRYDRTPNGAVLDLPFRLDARGLLQLMPRYVFLGGYHGRPLAACYNSFQTPLQAEIERLTERLPAAAAVDELYALGFRTIVVHDELLEPAGRSRLASLAEDPTRISLIGDAAGSRVLALSSPNAVSEDLASIVIDGPGATSMGGRGTIRVPFRNRTASTYRHPAPIEPSRLTLRWYDDGGALSREEEVRALLPIALAPGSVTSRAIEIDAPSTPGDYTLELEVVGERRLRLGRTPVRVGEGSSRLGRYGEPLAFAAPVVRRASNAPRWIWR